MHDPPAAHGMQVPALQTMLAPHDVPSARFPVVEQTDAPVEHDVVPALHVVPAGVQALPAAHITQVPPLQTRSVPHPTPLASAVPASVQVTAPPVQEIVP